MNHPISFTKMHGLGNDFVILNNLKNTITLDKSLIVPWANRHTGIGFDQLLMIEPGKKGDFFCKIFNADGSEATQCGNGLRCVARYIQEEKLHADSTLTLETKAGIYPITIQDFDHITVMMGAPEIQERLIELADLPVSILSIGNPHAIIKVESLHFPNAKEMADSISSNNYFTDGANIGFMHIVSPQHIRLRTFERGSGETHACGSNACAASVAGIINGWLQHSVTVEFPYGELSVNWDEEKQTIMMTGPASKVFEGKIS